MSLRRKCSNCAHSHGWFRWSDERRRHAFCPVSQAAQKLSDALGRPRPRIDQFSCGLWELADGGESTAAVKVGEVVKP